MAIEKKSLISNRTATKKAIITKPEVSKVAPTRLSTRFKAAGPQARIGTGHFRVKT